MATIKDTYLTKSIRFEITEEEHTKLMAIIESKYQSKKAVRRFMRFLVHTIISKYSLTEIP